MCVRIPSSEFLHCVNWVCVRAFVSSYVLFFSSSVVCMCIDFTFYTQSVHWQIASARCFSTCSFSFSRRLSASLLALFLSHFFQEQEFRPRPEYNQQISILICAEHISLVHGHDHSAIASFWSHRFRFTQNWFGTNSISRKTNERILLTFNFFTHTQYEIPYKNVYKSDRASLLCTKMGTNNSSSRRKHNIYNHNAMYYPIISFFCSSLC